jgi:hypothetical protein
MASISISRYPAIVSYQDLPLPIPIISKSRNRTCGYTACHLELVIVPILTDRTSVHSEFLNAFEQQETLQSPTFKSRGLLTQSVIGRADKRDVYYRLGFSSRTDHGLGERRQYAILIFSLSPSIISSFRCKSSFMSHGQLTYLPPNHSRLSEASHTIVSPAISG